MQGEAVQETPKEGSIDKVLPIIIFSTYISLVFVSTWSQHLTLVG